MHEPARCTSRWLGDPKSSMLDETVFRVTNFRHDTNPLSGRVFSLVNVTIQHFNESRQ